MTTFIDRLTELTPALMGKSRSFATPEYSADDIFQAVSMALYEKVQADPSFLDQKDGYWITLAEWTARHMNRQGRIYNKYVGQEEVSLDDNEEVVSDFELYIDSDTTEDVAGRHMDAQAIEKKMKSLTPENRQIVYLLFIGYSKAEIAAELHISRPALSQRLQTIQRHLHSIQAVAYKFWSSRNSQPSATFHGKSLTADCF